MDDSNTNLTVLTGELVDANVSLQTANTPAVPLVQGAMPSDAFSDYIATRQNYYDILMKGQLALERLVDIADASQNRSDYRVVGELITALTNTNEKLLDMHVKKRELAQAMNEPKGGGTVNIDKAIFTTTTDLLKQLTEEAKKK